jgi:hypothetical protein
MIGDEGMGKRTIAAAFAGENGMSTQELDGASVEVKADLTAVLTNLREREVLVMPNIHRLSRPFQEMLRQTTRDRKLEITIGHGASARRHTLEVRPFTLIGTAPKKSDCPPDLLSVFSLVLPLQSYSQTELQDVSEKIAKQIGLTIDPESCELVAANCQARPHHIEVLLQRLARAVNRKSITEQDTTKALSAFGFAPRTSNLSGQGLDLSQMSGIDFEMLVADLLGQMGFRAEMTKTTGDGGIDIVAVLDKPIIGGKYLFQCKRYAPDSLIGSPTVRDFYGAVTADRAVKGIFITTSDFTTQAREFGERVGLELINLQRLTELLAEHGKKVPLDGDVAAVSPISVLKPES